MEKQKATGLRKIVHSNYFAGCILATSAAAVIWGGITFGREEAKKELIFQDLLQYSKLRSSSESLKAEMYLDLGWMHREKGNPDSSYELNQASTAFKELRNSCPTSDTSYARHCRAYYDLQILYSNPPALLMRR
jgi:hypothetical protein